MARKRTYTDEQFINVVKKTYSIAQLLKELGLSFSGGNYIEAKKRLLKLNIDSSHFKGQKWAEGSHHKRNKKFPLEDLDLNLDYDEDLTSIFLPDGRYSFVELESHTEKIQAQQYLELFYKWIEPFVSALGTKKEIQNLEEFSNFYKKMKQGKNSNYLKLLNYDRGEHGSDNFITFSNKEGKKVIKVNYRDLDQELFDIFKKDIRDMLKFH